LMLSLTRDFSQRQKSLKASARISGIRGKGIG